MSRINWLIKFVNFILPFLSLVAWFPTFWILVVTDLIRDPKLVTLEVKVSIRPTRVCITYPIKKKIKLVCQHHAFHAAMSDETALTQSMMGIGGQVG